MVTLINAIHVAEVRRLKAGITPKPAPKVAAPQKDDSPAQALGQAADAMDAENYDDAVFVIKAALAKKPTGRMARMLKAMLSDAETALERVTYLRAAAREYRDIRELVQRESTRALGCTEFADFQRDYPDYDPDGLAALCSNSVTDSLPAPFEWIEIPAGKVTLITQKGRAKNYIPEGKSQTFDVPAFSIAKYPITNAQFAKFMQADGYNQRQWWTDAGWQQKESDGWTEPRYWNDSKWNGAEQPVVGVSWYEAVAFCLWLSEALTLNPSPGGLSITHKWAEGVN